MSKPRVGREFQHLEDLTYIEGSHGALAAADFLEKLAYDSSSVALKWDGGIVVYWGRDELGNFVMTGKNGWGKSKSKSADELAEFIMTSGKGESWRADFAKDMSKIFVILEQATPDHVRGYAKGDVLWHPGKPFAVDGDEIVFTPNLVTYCANVNSNIGKQIIQSQLGIAVHGMCLAFGSEHLEPPSLVSFTENKETVMFSQTYIANRIYVDQLQIENIKEKIKEYADQIDFVLEARAGLADIKNIVYSYVNYLVKNDLYHQVEYYFEEWLNKSKVSTNKKEQIKQIKESSKGFEYLFSVLKDLSTQKEKAIEQFDAKLESEKDLVRIKNVNEGYVCNETKLKLVPRTKWKPR